MKNKNQQSGFASILLGIVIILMLGSGVYFYSKQKGEVKIEETGVITNIQSTSTVATTTEVKAVSKNTLPDSEFLKVIPEGKILAKGDIDLDGTEDAIILEMYCGASCATLLQVVFNKNSKAENLTDSPDNFAPAFYGSSAAKSQVLDITIKNGIITLTGLGLDCMNSNSSEADYCTEEKWAIHKSVTYKFDGKNIVQLDVTSLANSAKK